MNETSPVRIMLVEDDSELRRSIEYLLLHWPGNDVSLAAACSTVAEALRAVEAHEVDVAVVDLHLPDGSGVEVIRALQRRQPPVPSLVLTMFDDSPSILEALQAGARGYLVKDIAPGELLTAIHEVASGDPPLSPEVRRTLIDQVRGEPADELAPSRSAPAPGLTSREHEILNLFVRGHTYHCVAEALGLAVGTVQSHVKSIYKKLDVSSKAEAVAAAVRLRRERR